MKNLFRSFMFLVFAALSACVIAQATDRSGTPRASTEENTAPMSLEKCLPAGITLATVVEASGSHRITVEKKLSSLKAVCSNKGKLVDGSGREIVFYHLIGCWGHPPPDYQKILQEQRREIERLKQHHTVIELTCNPSGTRIP